ncbi:hypothetical protein JZ751_002125 [Albula glossodonta]|uniref:Uncharacterized protein n=1 Tax=Albula glossodonta TaxID=121402 RepID=A0A8T2P8Z4_9TELE|nr:hypothetical protein JZ751_002125 [Albula glossodonta]
MTEGHQDDLIKLLIQSCDWGLESQLHHYKLWMENSGKRHEELSNEADYVNYRRASNKEYCVEFPAPPAYPPLTYLPQSPYTQQSSNSATYSYPPPPVPYTFPKEQYV